jgi:hypothetical protein
MMTSRYASQDSFEYGLYDEFEKTQTQSIDVAQRGVTLGATREHREHTTDISARSARDMKQADKLGFCQLSERDDEGTYHEDAPLTVSVRGKFVRL